MPTTRHFNTPLHLSAAVIVFFLLSGCAAYNRIQNTPTTKDSALLNQLHTQYPDDAAVDALWQEMNP